jgi:hypothetical protein
MTSRKDAIRAYKERPPNMGAFAIRCVPDNRCWVGTSRNLTAAQNSAWFSLRMGMHRNRDLQAAWTTHGEAAFEFEIVEKLDEDIAPMAVADVLKEKLRVWAERLQAPQLLP